jgi:carbonyl reductase 1
MIPTRVAVVSGSNQGVGFFIALQLALSGKFGNVILGCRNEQRGIEAMQKIQSQVDPELCRVNYEPLVLGDPGSHSAFAQRMEQEFGKVDVLINNAAIAFKGADPTPFQGQTKPTLDVNFRGTVDFTEKMLPLVRRGIDPRIVSVSSMAGRLSQVHPDLQQRFAAPDLTMGELQHLMDTFEADVQAGIHKQKGWSNSNYGMSKLGVTAATRVWARENPGVAINCCCPGYCSTSMSSYRGTRDPAEGARNACIPALMDQPPTGQFFQDFEVSQW